MISTNEKRKCDHGDVISVHLYLSSYNEHDDYDSLGMVILIIITIILRGTTKEFSAQSDIR